jgi:hypothetical protein
MSLFQFIKFTQDCGIVDNKSTGCKASDLDTIFISTNFEEDAGTQESDANDDNALCRFEFLEIIVRAAFGKYITSKVHILAGIVIVCDCKYKGSTFSHFHDNSLLCMLSPLGVMFACLAS